MSRTGELFLEKQEARKEELLKLIREHDCHMSSESGCICVDIAQELSDLGYEFYSTPIEDLKPF